MTIEECPYLIIGTGEAGKYLAWTLAKQGNKAIVVERSLVGGACPNVACLPSKNVIHSAKVASLCKNAQEFGVETGPIKINMAKVYQRKRRMVEGLAQMHMDNFAKSGAELVRGEARFLEPGVVRVAMNGGGDRVFRAQKVFLNLGSRATIPPIGGLAESMPLTHVEALDLERVPEHLIVLGGGYVGLEFAQAMRRFGSKVSVIQHGPQILGHEDADVVEAVMSVLRDEGIDVWVNSSVQRVVGKSGARVTLEIKRPQGTQILEGSDILVATGRTPNTDRFGAEQGRIELDARGFIKVDERLKTSAANVWAMGDCAGSPHFTHASFDDFRVVRDNLAGKDRTTQGRVIPYCLFTDPELAHVGLSETEAKNKGIGYRLAKMPMAMALRTRTIGDTRGFAKALIGADDRILGFTVLGAEASEMMAVVQTAMMAGMTYSMLANGIFTHPTVAEGVMVLMSQVGKK